MAKSVTKVFFLQERVHLEGAGLHQGRRQVSASPRLLRNGSLRLLRRLQVERLPDGGQHVAQPELEALCRQSAPLRTSHLQLVEAGFGRKTRYIFTSVSL